MTQKQIKAVSAKLELFIPESDLKKIKQSKNPLRTKTFKAYSELLLDIIKKLDISEIEKKEKSSEISLD